MKFDKPTLVTITAPTCSGKSVLLNAMVEQGFQRIVSTTTRRPRAGEWDGVDYHFITEQKSHDLEAAKEFAELIEFKGIRYGVTKAEMAAKLSGEFAPVVVLEPQGLKAYEEYCALNGWSIFKIFIYTTESVLIERLNERTYQELAGADFNLFRQVVKTHTDRLLSITGDERRWGSVSTWDVLVPGDDLSKALADVEQAIKWRNHRTAVPHG